MMPATVTTTQRHLVRVIHASTRRPITALHAQLRVRDPHRWSVRIAAGTIVCVGRDIGGLRPTPAPASPAVDPAPAAPGSGPGPVLVVTIADGAVAQLLDLPPVPGLPAAGVEVPLTEPEVEVALPAVAQVLEVILADPAGDPRTGARLTARARRGPAAHPDIAVVETADPGVYRSAPTRWTADLTPADLLVDGRILRGFAMDFARRTTRLRAVDTT